MKILVIHEVSYLEKPVYEYQDFAERLAGRGHDVTVIDFCEGTNGGLLKQRVSRTGTAEVQLITLPNSGLPVVKYLLVALAFPFFLKQLIKDEGVDAVLLYSVFINGMGTVAVCKKLGIPVVYRVLDEYHRLRADRLQSWLLLQGERYIYRNANILSVTNKQMETYVAEVAAPGRFAPVQVTDHGVDVGHFCRVSFNERLATRFSLQKSDFICLFLGTTYAFSRLDVLVQHMKQIRASIPGFKMLILGAGELDDSIRAAAVDSGLSAEVIQVGMVPYKDLPDYLALGTIAICPFAINAITRNIIPIKILQYLGAELPVIATPLPDLQRKIPHELSGVYYSETDEISSFVRELTGTVATMDIRAVGARARCYVSEQHSMGRVISEIEELLEGKWNI